MNEIRAEKKYYTAKEVANELGLHINTIYNYIKSGELKSVKIGRKWYITAKELERVATEGIDVS